MAAAATIALLAVAAYPIGSPLKPWTAAEYAAWRAQTTVHRSYRQEVLSIVAALTPPFCKLEYGILTDGSLPLVAVRNEWLRDRPCVLITGGVHGYETSGVRGALEFLRSEGERYAKRFNLLVVPCVSPWSYERKQRWNAAAIDPNRSFRSDGVSTDGRDDAVEPAEESVALKSLLESCATERWLAHIDLHETSDADEVEFRPAAAARDGELVVEEHVPDGFYLVADAPARALLMDVTAEHPEWLDSIISAVAKVTHIASADEYGQIGGMPLVQNGVVTAPTRSLGLCSSVTNAEYSVTTEVNPDSPHIRSEEECTAAQVAALVAALDALNHD